MKVKQTSKGIELTGSKKEIDRFAFAYSCSHPMPMRWDILNPKAWRL